MQINFSTGYIDPDEMISESYPPINQQTRAELYDENTNLESSYQDKVWDCMVFGSFGGLLVILEFYRKWGPSEQTLIVHTLWIL